MKTPKFVRGQRGMFAAFTQIELLVVVVVVAVIAMLGFSASLRLSNQTRIAQCSNNLRQLNLGQLLYAADNLDNLPPNRVVYWPWDLSVPVAIALNQYGVTPKTMYCPGTAPRFTDLQNFANTSPRYGNNSSLWNFGVTADPPELTDYHIIGYSLTLQNGALAYTNINYTVTPQPITIGSLVIPAQNPSQRVLTADAILSPNENDQFYSIAGGFLQQGVTYPFTSPHLDGMVPAGCNVAMLDGHVEWRQFKQMKIRTASKPYFYW